MSYPIEILSADDYLYKSLQVACDSLNKVQKDFLFKLPPQRLRPEPFSLKSQKYSTGELFSWLSEYRKTVQGYRPYLILVVDGFLYNETGLQNIFGSHRAYEGLAVFTTYSFSRYVKDIVRFCGYYLVRYMLSFLAPGIKSHNLEEHKDCLFHKKINKTEIRLSMSSGKLCDICKKQLIPRLNQEVGQSIESLLKVISNQFPLAIVMKGGGVKGLAFAGALKELEKHFLIDSFAGTSAGAIAALLCGAGFSPEELHKILFNQDFREFKDSYFPITLFNLLTRNGFYPGKRIELWLSSLIQEKLANQISEVKMSDLRKRTTVYASRVNDGTLVFSSHGERSEHHAAFAGRCSMSIPFVFMPKRVDGIKVYDGGLRNNFPLRKFIEDNPSQPFLGLYLNSTRKKSPFIINELLNMIVEGEERQIVDAHMDKMIIIETDPIHTTQFNLTVDQKRYLVISGRIAALRYISMYHPDLDLGEKDILNKLADERTELRKKFDSKFRIKAR